MNEQLNYDDKENLDLLYKHSQLQQMLDKQKRETGQSIVLFSDIDHTYQKEGKEDAMDDLTTKLETEHIPTVAVTGNNFAAVMKRIEAGKLPYFQVIAGSVGTEVWVLEDDGVQKTYKKDMAFEHALINSGYLRTALLPKCFSMVEAFQTMHPEYKFDFQLPEEERQYLEHPKEEYQKFKISFYFFSNQDSFQTVVSEVKGHFPEQQIVVCEEIGFNKDLPANAPLRKYCLDILPITKAEAVKRIAQTVNVTKALVAGDSGNDVDMLLTTDEKFIAILVGEAKSEAVAAIHEAVTEKDGQRSFHYLKNNPKKIIYIEQNKERAGPESILHALDILKRIPLTNQ